MSGTTFTFTGPLWRWTAKESTWLFVTVPPVVCEVVRELAGEPRGFGSVRVSVRVGLTSWETSVFPDKESGCFVLPMKKAVRVAESLDVDDPATVELTVIR